MIVYSKTIRQKITKMKAPDWCEEGEHFAKGFLVFVPGPVRPLNLCFGIKYIHGIFIFSYLITEWFQLKFIKKSKITCSVVTQECWLLAIFKFQINQEYHNGFAGIRSHPQRLHNLQVFQKSRNLIANISYLRQWRLKLKTLIHFKGTTTSMAIIALQGLHSYL